MKNKQRMQTEIRVLKSEPYNDLSRTRNIYMEIQENQMIFSKNRSNTLLNYFLGLKNDSNL